jgi:predicted SprT family Zn-dependent metalloprotease
MYATTENGRIYHLVARGGEYTLCGLRILRARRVQETNESSKMVCKHCERINKSNSD